MVPGRSYMRERDDPRYAIRAQTEQSHTERYIGVSAPRRKGPRYQSGEMVKAPHVIGVVVSIYERKPDSRS
jgi:hypothetical protein